MTYFLNKDACQISNRNNYQKQECLDISKKPWVAVVFFVTTLALLAFVNGLDGEFVFDDRAF